MSIAQQIMANPGRYSIQQLQSALNDGLIPAYIAIPLIEQKTKEAGSLKLNELAANAPQDDSPTIAEQVLAQADQGLDQLPSNLPVEGYAPGGIVAFADEGLVEDEDKEEEFDATPAGLMKLFRSTMPTQTAEEQVASGIKAIRGMRTSGDDVTGDIRNYIQQQKDTAAERAKSARANRFIELGANILASKDRYATGAIGQGLAKTMPGFISDEKAAEEEGLKYLQMRNELEKQRRAEESADIAGGINLYGHMGTEGARRSAAAARMASALSRLTQGQQPKGFDNLANANFNQYMVEIRTGQRPPPLGADKKPLEGADLEAVVRGQATQDAARTWKEFGPTLGLQGVLAGVGERGRTADRDRTLREEIQISGVAGRVADDVRADFSDRRSALAKKRNTIRKEYGEGAASIFEENERRRRFNDDPSVPKERHLPLLPETWKSTEPAAQSPATSQKPMVAPSAAVNFLKQNDSPAMRQMFDAKYGQGAAARALGK